MVTKCSFQKKLFVVECSGGGGGGKGRQRGVGGSYLEAWLGEGCTEGARRGVGIKMREWQEPSFIQHVLPERPTEGK